MLFFFTHSHVSNSSLILIITGFFRRLWGVVCPSFPRDTVEPIIHRKEKSMILLSLSNFYILLMQTICMGKWWWSICPWVGSGGWSGKSWPKNLYACWAQTGITAVLYSVLCCILLLCMIFMTIIPWHLWREGLGMKTCHPWLVKCATVTNWRGLSIERSS